MTKLPDRSLLDGSKSPETTTGEFRLAMGKLRQYLFELLGDDGKDKETARLALGIDLVELIGKISEKADEKSMEIALLSKVDIAELAGVAFTGSYGDLLNIPDAIPSGFIGMWCGALDKVPAGWTLCNGEKGTPDLRDKFIVGAGRNYVVGKTGGAISTSISGNTGETTLSTAQIPSHQHGIAGHTSGGYESGSFLAGAKNYTMSGAQGGGGSHAHSISGTVAILPPYYSLAYIMKV